MDALHPALRPAAPRLSAAARRGFFALIGLLFITGLTWLVYEGRTALDGTPLWQIGFALKLHGACAMLFLLCVGWIGRGHALPAWRHGRVRISGVLMITGLALLTATGWGLYYVDGELPRRISEWLHWILGFGLPLGVLWHIVWGRRHRIRAGAAMRPVVQRR